MTVTSGHSSVLVGEKSRTLLWTPQNGNLSAEEPDENSRYTYFMGDSGEGLIDNEARIQERMEELQQNRAQARKPTVKNAQLKQQIESLQLARKEMARSRENATHESRRAQLTAALADIDRRIKQLQERV
jgi:chromosome segregation ATPase